MQRVRIGLTGLAFVFLAVLLAAILTGRRQDEAPITPKTIEAQRAGLPPAPAPGAAQRQTAEPLAELGVAPGAVESNAAANAAASAANAPRR